MEAHQALASLRLVLRSIRDEPDRAIAEGVPDEDVLLRIRKRIYRNKAVAERDVVVVREALMTVEKWVE